ncbi:MAG: ferritin-like domain-containing protein [Chloroflexi bacterium]|nr:ferritin-like domain-containing protein [Chloroflexota bacterium]
MHNLQNLYVEQLRDIYDAETQLVSALPRMAQSAVSRQLQQAFVQHLNQTRLHVQRLEEVFLGLKTNPYGETCEAMRGLIREGEKIMQRDRSASVRDAALIAAAQRVEHYEIAAYGTVCVYADELDDATGRRLLSDTLSEEQKTDIILGELAEEVITPDPLVKPQPPGLAALYHDFSSARATIEALVDAGIGHERLSLIANYRDERYAAVIQTMRLSDETVTSPTSKEGAGFGAIVGALAGLGIALIPGVGGFVVTGAAGAALFAGIGAVAGVVTGGLTAGLIDIGIDEDRAVTYTEGLGNGGALVVAHVDDIGREQVETIMRWYNPAEIQPIGPQ